MEVLQMAIKETGKDEAVRATTADPRGQKITPSE